MSGTDRYPVGAQPASESQFARLRARTSTSLIAEHARERPGTVAYRAKHRGLYRERTWADYAALVGQCAMALRSLGVGHGDRVAIMGDAAEGWVIADQAAQALGAITFGIYPTASGSEVAYQMRDAGARVFIAEDQEYVDKILGVAADLPDLAAIVVIDGTAMFGYAHDKLHRLDDLLANAGSLADGRNALDDLAPRTAATDPAFIVYTSGTTGNPKGALISHGKHLAGAYTIVDHYTTLRDTTHRTVVFLPLCHIFGRDVGITLPLISRLVPHFGDDVDDLLHTLVEVGPTVLFTVPRYMQKFAAQILVELGATSPVKKIASDAALGIARAAMRRHWAGKGSASRIAHAATRAAVFRPMLAKIGLDRLQLAVSGGAALPPETTALWQMWGVDLVEAYGQTETGGAFISAQPAGFPRPGNVGVISRGWEARLSDSGELLVRGSDAFEGYWGNPAATAEVVDAEGFMHTGDVAEWVEGNKLKLIDRARDFLVTSGGKTISPSAIENVLRGSPYIAEAMVIGHGRKYLTALIEIDLDSVADWARNNDIAYTGFKSLATNPRVNALIGAEVEKANRELARVETVKTFRILPKELDPEEEGEPVTPTRKVKRAQMQARYSELIASMYEDSEERRLSEAAGGVLAAT